MSGQRSVTPFTLAGKLKPKTESRALVRTDTLSLEDNYRKGAPARFTALISSGIKNDNDFKNVFVALKDFMRYEAKNLHTAHFHKRNVEAVAGIAFAMAEDYLRGLSEKSPTIAKKTFDSELARLKDIRLGFKAAEINLGYLEPYPYSTTKLAQLLIADLRLRACGGIEPSIELKKTTGFPDLPDGQPHSAKTLELPKRFSVVPYTGTMSFAPVAK